MWAKEVPETQDHSIPDNVTTDDTGRVSDILLLSHAVQEILLFRGVAGLLNGLDTRDPQVFCELSCKAGHEVRVSTAGDGDDAIDALFAEYQQLSGNSCWQL